MQGPAEVGVCGDASVMKGLSEKARIVIGYCELNNIRHVILNIFGEVWRAKYTQAIWHYLNIFYLSKNSHHKPQIRVQEKEGCG